VPAGRAALFVFDAAAGAIIGLAVAESANASTPRVLVQDGDRWLVFEQPVEVLEAREPGDVLDLLRLADGALAAGRWLAGYVGYEAAAAFGLATQPPDPDGPPVFWLGVFEAPCETSVELPGDGAPSPQHWRPALDPRAYAAALASVHERIAAGDTYQANVTFPLVAPLAGEAFELFARLVAVQRPSHAAFLDLGRFAVASASPELFFRREAGVLTARPMKGTAPRGATAEKDAALAAALRGSEKERAENLMVVDMLRNDLGRVAEVGSVSVEQLFEIERYPTLLQMTSSVRARSAAPLSAVLAALFPCASVTGAPKARTMEIIAATEIVPRGVYTGAIGWAAPGGDACFSVAIRTVVADRLRGTLAYGVGSGVVADSDAEREYEECLLKARVLEEPPFSLVETMAFLPGEGFRLLDGHLARLAASARHFAFPFQPARIEAELRRVASSAPGPLRVRLLLRADGTPVVQAAALPAPPQRPLRVGLAARPVDSGSPWLYHKTTRREVYEDAAASRPDCDDVLLWNERGELTESSVANVVVELAGVRVTPPVACGLLPGVERSRALVERRAREAVVRLSDLRAGRRVWLLSSLRGVREAVFVG
jgi:para-aminobenzoate synthetase/4-amino-4-deoxychorismate lyase